MHNDLMEKKAIACIIKDPKAQAEGLTQLTEAHFYVPQNRDMFRILKDIYKSKGKITWTLFQRELFSLQEGLTDEAIRETTATVEAYMDSYSVLDDWPSIKQTLSELNNIRQLKDSILSAGSMLEKDIPYEDKIKKYQEILFQPIQDHNVAKYKHISQGVDKFAAEYALRLSGDKEHGVYTSIESINRRCDGLKKGRLYVLAGRPGMGKTALALNINKDIGMTKKDGIALMFSLEMYEDDLAERLATMELGVDSKYFTKDEYLLMEGRPQSLDRAMGQALDRVRDLNFYVCYKRGLTVDEIAGIARAAALEHGKINCITVDYLQLIRRQGRDEVAELGYIVRELRDLAGDLGCPLILLSQLNRGVEKRDDKRPMLSDLRASGEIEEAADVVILMYRDEYYGKDEAASQVRGVLELIYAKVRQGEPGVDYIEFLPASMQFNDLSKERIINYKEAVAETGGSPALAWEPEPEQPEGVPYSVSQILRKRGFGA